MLAVAATVFGVGLGIVVGLVAGFSAARWWAARTDAISGGVIAIGAADGTIPDVAESLREAVDHLEIGVLVAGVTGAVVYRNAAAQAFSGTHVGILVDDHVAAAVAASRAGARSSRIAELQGPPKQWLEISADPVANGGAIVSIRDVSERVRTDAMRSDFVTNISHELKTPVGAVAVLAEALVDESDPSVIQRLSEHLVEEAHRAVQTIDDLLKLSEIESTRPGDDIIDLRNVVQSAVARGRAVDGGRGVEISSTETVDQVLLRGDERQLVSAVGNLVENAVKYSHAGDVVEVCTHVDADAVEVTVADRGIGIPTRDLGRVFERFYRVDKARSRDTGGTGLGLSIVRHVATNHGGEVLVTSQEGEGSTFVLRLPASMLVASAPIAAVVDARGDADE